MSGGGTNSPMPRVVALTLGPVETNCYIVAGPGSSEAALIDPVDSPETVRRAADQAGMRISRILLTHGHCDHILALAEMKRLTGAPVGVHLLDEPMLLSAELNGAAMLGIRYEPCGADFRLADGDVVRIGELTLQTLYTPGHTPGGLSFYAGGSDGTPGFVFSGDALFCGSIGRTDFPGGDHETLLGSIREKLFTLPDETIVLSGHGPRTTIGREKRANPFLQ